MTGKPGTTVLSFRVPRELKKRLESLAKSQSCNRSRLAVEAIQSYVDEREEQLARIDRGILDADAGRTVPHFKVKRYLETWGGKHHLSPPVCE